MPGFTAKILTEPVAAANASRLDRAGDLNKNVLVFDLGGGTFDSVYNRQEWGRTCAGVQNTFLANTYLVYSEWSNRVGKLALVFMEDPVDNVVYWADLTSAFHR